MTQAELTQLRQELAHLQHILIEAEADLVDQQAEVNQFEFEFEAKVGHLLDQLSILDQEIDRYSDLIETIRNRQIFGQAYLSVEKQYQRAWQKPAESAPVPPANPPTPAVEVEIKQLYRTLARRFHPDLASNEQDRQFRTERMTAINNAYAARSVAELQAIARMPSPTFVNPHTQTEADLQHALQTEITQCRHRLQTINAALRELKQRASVKLALEVKLARRRGEDLLANLARDLNAKVARKTAERDLLKSQVDQLGPDQGFIPIKR